ncbi:hypothetical protein P4V43_14105 [Brevibacillus fortis]|uniref:hypothetical protein n=1 Tax=Brevibacillus fortis TaxID=2126352 RepID=UPI002E1C8763|nr:hypothetical protein [Brevibacillus fortis]
MNYQNLYEVTTRVFAKNVALTNGTAKFGYNGPLATLIWKHGSTHYELTYHFYYEEDVEAKLVDIANTYNQKNLP